MASRNFSFCENEKPLILNLFVSKKEVLEWMKEMIEEEIYSYKNMKKIFNVLLCPNAFLKSTQLIVKDKSEFYLFCIEKDDGVQFYELHDFYVVLTTHRYTLK